MKKHLTALMILTVGLTAIGCQSVASNESTIDLTGQTIQEAPAKSADVVEQPEQEIMTDPDDILASSYEKIEGITLDKEYKFQNVSVKLDKPTLVYFFSHTCSYCQKNIPLTKELESRGINLVKLTNSTAKEVELFDKGYMKNTFIFDDQKLLDTLGVQGIPVIFLINSNGEVSGKITGALGEFVGEGETGNKIFADFIESKYKELK